MISKGNNGLWITDGTASGTVELTTYGFNITVLGNQALFNGKGQFSEGSIWTTDGTPGGTKRLANFPVGALPGFTVFGNQALFSDDTDVFGDTGLWITDGTSAGTHAIQNVKNPGFASIPSDITTIGNKAVFNAVDSKGLHELWETDGTASGTQEITTLSFSAAGAYGPVTASLNPTNIAAFGNKALFMGHDTNGHRALWITDGTSSGTKELVSDDINPVNFTAFGNSVLFNAHEPQSGAALWITDGTPAGTKELKKVSDLSS